MMRLETPSVWEFEKDLAKGSPKFAEQELLKSGHGRFSFCVSDERGDQENSFICEIHSGYDLHSLDTFEYGDVLGNSAFDHKHKHLEMPDETESPKHISPSKDSSVLDKDSAYVKDTEQITHDDKILKRLEISDENESPRHVSSKDSSVFDEDSAYVKDTKRITHDDKIFKVKIYGACPLLVSETSEQENVAPIDLEHARRSKMDPVAISILSKETEPGQVSSSWWYSWRNVWCISLLVTILQQVVKQRQSKYRWFLLLLYFLPVITGETSPVYVQVQENGTATLVLYYDLNSTQHTIQAHLDHRPPNKTNFDPVVVVSILSENNFTVTSNPWGCDLVNLTKKMIIVRILFVRPEYAGDYRFTAMDPETTSNTCSLIVTDIGKCVEGAHGCAHNCTNQEEGPICSCFVGYILNEDNKTCKENAADVGQKYNSIILIVGGAVVLLLVLIGIGVYCRYPKLFNFCCKTTASASENSAEDDRTEKQPLQGNNEHLQH